MKVYNNERFLRIKEVVVRTGLSNSTVWDKVKKDNFPKPIKLSEKVTVWVNSEISQWIEDTIHDYRFSL